MAQSTSDLCHVVCWIVPQDIETKIRWLDGGQEYVMSYNGLCRFLPGFIAVFK